MTGWWRCLPHNDTKVSPSVRDLVVVLMVAEVPKLPKLSISTAKTLETLGPLRWSRTHQRHAEERSDVGISSLSANEIATLVALARNDTKVSPSVRDLVVVLMVTEVLELLKLPKLSILTVKTLETLGPLRWSRTHQRHAEERSDVGISSLSANEIDLRSSLLRLGKVCKQPLPSA